MQEQFNELIKISEELGYEEHIKTDYGEEATFRTPWEVFSKEETEEAFQLAEKSLRIANDVLTKWGKLPSK